nr:MAG TPA: hypothetical protein [Caudoviricetes sp.]
MHQCLLPKHWVYLRLYFEYRIDSQRLLRTVRHPFGSGQVRNH